MVTSSDYLWHKSENGRFFVGTKSVFNKVPKINYTSADIRRNHSGVVAEKLSACLTYLVELLLMVSIKVIYYLHQVIKKQQI